MLPLPRPPPTQVVASCAVRGYKVTRAPMLIQLTAFWLVALPLGCALGLAPAWLPGAPAEPWQARGFWMALVLGLTVAAIGLALLPSVLSISTMTS